MSQTLDVLRFPLKGSALIEASAGTGKTWTLAALYLRLVLGHGGEHAYRRPLQVSEILVMTFTRAATQELVQRIRERLLAAAVGFREGRGAPGDAFLQALLDDTPSEEAKRSAAYRLQLAAEAMDDAAIFTIDAWCQRILREHAFDSGCRFDETLVAEDVQIFEDAARDYWRQQVYPMSRQQLDRLLPHWKDFSSLKQEVNRLRRHEALIPDADDQLSVLLDGYYQRLSTLKRGWDQRVVKMRSWFEQQWGIDAKCFNGQKIREGWVKGWMDGLESWASSDTQVHPVLSESAWNRLSCQGIQEAYKGKDAIPSVFDKVMVLRAELAKLPSLKSLILQQASRQIVQRMQFLKNQAGQLSFSDLQDRLHQALHSEQAEVLRMRVIAQYPVALIDEFQDTAPVQYDIFNQLYRVAENHDGLGLFLIGDPKQSIYAFRGADIHSYISARAATQGRHYRLDTNFRSSASLVAAVNGLFNHAEKDAVHFPRGAFGFRGETGNPLPFEPVQAKGRPEVLQRQGQPLAALTCWYSQPSEGTDQVDSKQVLAEQCAEHIVGLLQDTTAGFRNPTGALERIKPADIAILVRDRHEAAMLQRALTNRAVASVYLSDKNSVFATPEAEDILHWLRAMADPRDASRVRRALVTRSVNLPLSTLLQRMSDDVAWEAQVNRMAHLHEVWVGQGVLAALRQFIFRHHLPAQLLAQSGGERCLTNLLHVAELLQQASHQVQGELALIRWLQDQIQSDHPSAEESLLRLESEAALVKIVTIHKSKGLEYPLVYLPFADALKQSSSSTLFFLPIRQEDSNILDFSLSASAWQAFYQAQLEENLRLLYVAMTRARHALFLGIQDNKPEAEPKQMAALQYLLKGSAQPPEILWSDHLQALQTEYVDINLLAITAPVPVSVLKNSAQPEVLIDSPVYQAKIEKDWSLRSYSFLTRALVYQPQTMPPAIARLLEDADEEFDDDGQMITQEQLAPWHALKGGAEQGNFMHAQLEWLAREGWNKTTDQGFQRRLTKQDWAPAQDLSAWLSRLVSMPLPELGVSLNQLDVTMPEMEFWFSYGHVMTAQIDAFCETHLFPGQPRPKLPPRSLHGMLKGYIDLVVEHEGRYWVIDYKSNKLGANDLAYQGLALRDNMLKHRYDLQGMIYLLALHRLLRQRLNDYYDPSHHLGGALFYYLRGVNHPGQSVLAMRPSQDMLELFDRLLQGETA